jgi:hypothetical protein
MLCEAGRATTLFRPYWMESFMAGPEIESNAHLMTRYLAKLHCIASKAIWTAIKRLIIA